MISRLVCIFLAASSPLLFSQDFGYEYNSVQEFRSLGMSVNAQQFLPAASNSMPDSQRLSFSSPLPFFEYRQMDVRIAVGYQEFTIQNRSRSSFTVALEQSNDYPLAGKKGESTLLLPIAFSSNFVKAEGIPGKIRNFEIGSVGLGTGLRYRYVTRQFALQVTLIALYHYSTVGFSTEYGSQKTFSAELFTVFSDILFDGVVIGARIDQQEWDISGIDLDYRRTVAGPFVAIVF